jgi:sporulation protein YlmC with PRC-barrel domain
VHALIVRKRKRTMPIADKKRPRFIIPLEDVVATAVIIVVLAAIAFTVTRLLT